MNRKTIFQNTNLELHRREDWMISQNNLHRLLFFKRSWKTIFQNLILEHQLQLIQLCRKRLDIAAKQTLSSGILRKELEDDLPEYEFGTLNTSCQNLEKRRLEESMEQDMDISPEQSPQKKVCKIDENSNMSSNITLFADAPPMSPVNASWYPSV